jgi:peptidoglycan hydrolase-like protein with peptidoglycan-binding domain
MQNLIEIQRVELKRLKLRLAETEAERDRYQQELKSQKPCITKDTSTDLWRSASVAALTVLTFATLFYAGVSLNAERIVNNNGQFDVAAAGTLPDMQSVNSGPLSASTVKPPSQADEKTFFYNRAKSASQQQWGPSLVIPGPSAGKQTAGFDPVVKTQQENLLTLGFDVGEADGFKGPSTRRAIAEFRALYLPDSGSELKDADLAVIMSSYANLARSDAARYGVDHGIVAAIRLSSVRTGVDFPYLMKLAAAESNFEPESKASTSSATGLYQFTHDTWLNTLKTHGDKYGLVADYAANIKYKKSWSGYQRPVVRDETIYQHLLELRKNPRLSAMMAAETVRDSQQKLAQSLDREPTETDLYLTHFLGTDDAITFLQSLKQSPDMHAVELFPEAARSNHRIFHPETCAPRTVDEVYALFGEKFSTRRYEEPFTRKLSVQSVSLQVHQTSPALEKTVPYYQWEQGRAL